MRGERYEVLIDTPARRILKKLPADLQLRLVSRIELLRSDPRPAGAVKLSGHNAFRIRIGDYRIIYTIEDARLIVLVVDIGHRRDIYRGW